MVYLHKIWIAIDRRNEHGGGRKWTDFSKITSCSTRSTDGNLENSLSDGNLENPLSDGNLENISKNFAK